MEQANVRVEVGAMFATKKQLKAACQTFATRMNFEYKVLKSDKSRMIIKCIGKGCSWRLHASNVDGVNDMLILLSVTSPFQIKFVVFNEPFLWLHFTWRLNFWIVVHIFESWSMFLNRGPCFWIVVHAFESWSMFLNLGPYFWIVIHTFESWST